MSVSLGLHRFLTDFCVCEFPTTSASGPTTTVDESTGLRIGIASTTSTSRPSTSATPDATSSRKRGDILRPESILFGRMYEESTSLTWRPLTPTSEDARAAADLLNAMETVDKIGENYDEEDTLQELIDPYVDLERASLAAFAGDVMVGYMKTRYKPSAEEVHRVFLDGGVHPDYRRRGVGTVLVEAGVAAAKILHALHHPTLKLVVDVQKAEHIAGVADSSAPRASRRSATTSTWSTRSATRSPTRRSPTGCGWSRGRSRTTRISG
jgi:GNAT superfamily N-acetyltransferase